MGGRRWLATVGVLVACDGRAFTPAEDAGTTDAALPDVDASPAEDAGSNWCAASLPGTPNPDCELTQATTCTDYCIAQTTEEVAYGLGLGVCMRRRPTAADCGFRVAYQCTPLADGGSATVQPIARAGTSTGRCVTPVFVGGNTSEFGYPTVCCERAACMRSAKNDGDLDSGCRGLSSATSSAPHEQAWTCPRYSDGGGERPSGDCVEGWGIGASGLYRTTEYFCCAGE